MPPAAPLVLLPTFRLRDALRVLAVVERTCDRCGHVEPVDVVGLAAHAGAGASVMGAVAALACSRCGHREGRETVTPHPHGQRYTLRLGDLIAPRARLVAVCRACWRRQSIDALALACARTTGPDALLTDLAERMRCTGCGQRGWVRLRLD